MDGTTGTDPKRTSLPMSVFLQLTKYCLLAVSFIVPSKYKKNIAIIIKTLPRDVKTMVAAVHILFMSYYYRYFNCNAISEFEKLVDKHPNKICFKFEEQIWTFSQVDVFSNKIANIFRTAGYKKGDVVALMMSNRPEYICIWLGLGKIGVIAALINTNLKNKALVHCVTAASCRAVIFSNDFASDILHIRNYLESTVRYFQLGGGAPKEGISSLDNSLCTASVKLDSIPPIDFNQHMIYIYTSGTTGFPKAAIMPHSRFLLMSIFARYLLGLTKDDVVYDPLPLYHTAGGLLGTSTAITLGASVVLKPKFSASNYISDCIKYQCTVGQYIGEICRYVLAVPPKPSDKEHCLKMIFGNGLRPAIWKQFSTRFNITNVMEIYGSTEGNLQFVNLDNKIGAVGSIPCFLPSCLSRYIGAIIKVDMGTMEPIRNSKGFCIECDPDEPGMFVGLIAGKNSLKEVYGYLDKKESNKKIIHNVFKKGDKAFVSGDILTLDEMGYLYFKDRTGDTFRWKGENVATSEVEAVISSIIGLRDCIVYGVQVSDLEGRAGMAAIVDPNNHLDLDQLAKSLNSALPKYAHPLFVRLLPEVELTGTFKLKKTKLQEEGFNPSILKDPIYFKMKDTYVKLDDQLYQQILDGAIAI